MDDVVDAKENIAMFDSTALEASEFIRGLVNATGYEWSAKICRANQGRKNWFDNLRRYFLYYAFPFKIFLQRKRYNHIIGWQAFYGLIFAFYCRLFHVKKCNTLVIKNLTYKPKRGVIGKIYFLFMKFIVKSKYVDIFICTSQNYCKKCAAWFEEPEERFVFLPFGVNDFSKDVPEGKPNSEKYILALGRSNRDWNFLIQSLKNTGYDLRIACDELKIRDEYPNIRVLNQVWDKKALEMIRDCEMMIIPILDGAIAAGETVLLQAMSFSKPVIITEPSCLAEAYVEHEKTGFIIKKDKDALCAAIKQLRNDPELYKRLAGNSRRVFEEKYSLYSYGIRVGNLELYQTRIKDNARVCASEKNIVCVADKAK